MVAFYWSYQTITTVGFGDVNANGNYIEQIMCSIWMITGVAFQSYQIGIIVQIMSSDQSNESMEKKIQHLRNIQRRNKVPSALINRIMNHIK